MTTKKAPAKKKATKKAPAKKKAKKKAPAKKTATKKAPAKKKAAPAKKKATPALKTAMTGRASAAKAAVGDDPVFAYIASLPEPQQAIAERVDALAAQTLPKLQRSVKWGMAWYGVGDGWCFSCGAFVGHVKLTFGRARR